MSIVTNSSARRLAVIVSGAALALAACTSSGSTAPSSGTPSSGSTTASPASSTSTASSASSSATTAAANGVDAAFLTKADAVCAAGITYAEKHPFPIQQFDPSKPHASQLPDVAAYDKKTPDVVTTLINLSPPTRGRTAWQRVVTVLEELKRNDAVETTAAENADRQGYVLAVKRAGTIASRLRTAAGPAGLLAAKNCVSYFTG